jgi:hypothetical protein
VPQVEFGADYQPNNTAQGLGGEFELEEGESEEGEEGGEEEEEDDF